MSDEKKYDEETQKFYDENREMIEKILAKEKESSGGRDLKYVEEMAKRAAFEAKMRTAFEAEKARRMAFVRADQLHSDMIDARICTEEAYEEARDHAVKYGREQADYFYDLMEEEFDRIRAKARRSREYARRCYEEDREEFREFRERTRGRANEGFDEFFRPFTDEHFQKHLVGAGLEFWMALNAFVRAAPLPDSLKEAVAAADLNKNKEFCSKNQDCPKKPASGEATPGDVRKITITPIKKEERKNDLS